MSLNREEIIKSKSYKVTRAALDWYKGNPDADVIDGFEAGWDAACEDTDGVKGHIKLWKEEFLDRAAEFIELYILNHDNIDIFEMEEEFIKAMEE